MNKKIIVIVGGAFIILAIAIAFQFRGTQKLLSPSATIESSVIPNELDLPLSSPSLKPLQSLDKIGVVLLGYGGAGHQGGFLSDVILLAYIDIPRNQVAFIHIPRDLWVNLSVNNTIIPTKINGALALGTKSGNYPTKDLPDNSILRGSYLSKMAITQVTGLSIDYVIGVDFNGFSQAIDALKGIEVMVPHTFDDPWYPVRGRELETCGKSAEDIAAVTATMSGFTLEKQFPCRYEHIHFDQGKNTMNGSTALKFVRSRHSNTYGGDFARGERQTAVLVGVMNKLFSLKALDKVPEFFSLLQKSVTTDISVDAIKTTSPILQKLPSMKQKNIGISTANVLTTSTSKSGAYILNPKSGENQWQEVHSYIQTELNKE